MYLNQIDLVSTGNNIRKLRTRNKLRICDIQQMLGISSANTVYCWEHGITLPTIDNALILCAIFGVRLDEIIVYEIKEVEDIKI